MILHWDINKLPYKQHLNSISHEIDPLTDACKKCEYTVEELWNQGASGNMEIYTNCPGSRQLKFNLKKCECGGEAVGGRHSDWCVLYER